MLVRRATLIAAVICVAGTAHAACRMTLTSRLPLTPDSGHLLVPVTLDDKPAELIFDTGSFTTLLSLTAVARLGLRHMSGEEFNGLLATVSGIGGDKPAMGVTARTVNIGGLTGRNYNFLAADIAFPPSDGLLSTDLISQFDVDLDFPEDQVVLYRPIGDCHTPAAFLASPLYAVPLRPIGEDRRPRVTVSIGGQDVVAMIDTGAPHSAIFRRAAERLGLRIDDLAADAHGTAGGIGPRTVASVTHVFEPVTIGDLTFEHLPVDILDDRADDEVEMLLGADFQRQVHVWISYSSHTLIMQYPPRPSKKAG
jgi:predicted aspartyl protease